MANEYKLSYTAAEIEKKLGEVVDQFYDETSQNAQSGIAIAQAISNKQNKIVGSMGQIVGFDVNGNAVAQDISQSVNVSISETLPEATEDMRGKFIIIPNGDTDKLYVCMRISGVYTWVTFNDNTNNTTSVLGQATLGSMILGEE